MICCSSNWPKCRHPLVVDFSLYFLSQRDFRIKIWFSFGKRWLANNMTGHANVRLCNLAIEDLLKKCIRRYYFPSWAKETKNNSNNNSAWSQVKGTGSRFSACLLTKVLFFCRDMLYRLWKQFDHVIMLSKNQSAHYPGSHWINLGANSSKLINHGIKPVGQQ